MKKLININATMNGAATTANAAACVICMGNIINGTVNMVGHMKTGVL